MSQERPTRRGEMYPDEMFSMQLAPGWHDGRWDPMMCRINAVLDKKRLLRAEVTWMDDSEDEDNERGAARVYYDPVLSLETNQLMADGSWRAFDVMYFDISGDEACMLVQDDPQRILEFYRSEFDDLKVWKGAPRVA